MMTNAGSIHINAHLNSTIQLSCLSFFHTNLSHFISSIYLLKLNLSSHIKIPSQNHSELNHEQEHDSILLLHSNPPSLTIHYSITLQINEMPPQRQRSSFKNKTSLEQPLPLSLMDPRHRLLQLVRSRLWPEHQPYKQLAPFLRQHLRPNTRRHIRAHIPRIFNTPQTHQSYRDNSTIHLHSHAPHVPQVVINYHVVIF